MRSATQSSILAVCLLASFPLTLAHTWVEQLRIVAGNGTFVGPTGFPRAYTPRSAPNFGDPLMVNLLPPNGRSTGNAILATDLMCKNTQTIGSQSAGFPALSASPGDMVALRYLENGHVTKPTTPPGKPAHSGSVFVYGTTQPANTDTLLAIHKVWNTAGTGGDKRGVLLATRDFDDGECYEANPSDISVQRQKQFPHTSTALMGPNLWCQNDIALPLTAPTSGQYTLYWVWEWPTLANGKVVLNETYTTCIDVKMVAGAGTSKSLNFKTGQDLNFAAIKNQLSSAVSEASGAPAGAAPTSSAAKTSGQGGAKTSSSPAKSSSAVKPSVIIPVGEALTVTVTAEAKPVTVFVTVEKSAAATSPAKAASSSSTPAKASSSTPAKAASSTPAKASNTASASENPSAALTAGPAAPTSIIPISFAATTMSTQVQAKQASVNANDNVVTVTSKRIITVTAVRSASPAASATIRGRVVALPQPA